MVLLEKDYNNADDDNSMNSVTNAILKKIKLDTSYNIPYTAGYSEDGSIIYIDKNLPRSYNNSKGEKVFVYPFLIMHEATEISLINVLGLNYKQAHRLALNEEQASVTSYGYDWKEYDKFMQEWTNIIMDMNIESVPKNLDLTPYEDMKSELLPAMREAQK